MWARKFGQPNMNHFYMFVEVSFLRKTHGTTSASVRPLSGVGAQVVKVFTHREYGDIAKAAVEKLEKPGLGG